MIGWMLGIATGAILLVALLAVRRTASLFSDSHLSRVAALVPDLKVRVLREGRAVVRTSMLGIVYSVVHDNGLWVHHLSIAGPAIHARSSGTFFLALVRTLVGLDSEPDEVFVSQNGVFHLVARLSDQDHQALADTAAAPKSIAELRRRTMSARGPILGKLEERGLPASAPTSTAA